MADIRVIQDSDDSEGAISDTATSIDPLQETNVALNDGSRDHDRDPLKTIVGQNHGLVSGNTGDVTVNFDSFLVSQSHEGQQATASQEQREELWIGGAGQGMTGSGIIPPEIETSHSEPPFSAISPNKTVLKRGRSTSPSDKVRHGEIAAHMKQKRRKTVEPSNTASWHQGGRAHEANFAVSADSNPSTGQNGLLADIFQLEGHSQRSSGCNDTSTAPTEDRTFGDAGSTTTKVPQVKTIDALSQDQSREEMFIRSRSAPMDPSSPHDTEPMSSLSFARACRANTEIDGTMLHSSFETSSEYPAPPESVQVVIADRDSKNYETHSSPNYKLGNDRDELDSEDFGGMDKECYKPRPSRSRSKPTHLVHIDQDCHKGLDPGLAVVIPQETPSAQPHCRGEECISDTEAEFTKDRQHDSKSPSKCHDGGRATEPIPLDATASSPQGSERSAFEPSIPTRKGTNGKLKRETTTSTSLNEVVDSEDEEDVIFLEEKPVAERIDRPPTPVDQAKQTGEMFQEVNKHSPTTVQPVSEDTHAEEPAEQPAEASGHKKRGRKRQKRVELTVAEPTLVSTDPPETLEDYNIPGTADTMRVSSPAAAEEDVNSTPQSTPRKRTKSATQATEGYEKDDGQDCHHPAAQATVPASTPQDQIPDPHHQEDCPKAPKTPAKPEKGPDKHSPISVTNRVSFRVGLSRKARIAPLLKVVKK